MNLVRREKRCFTIITNNNERVTLFPGQIIGVDIAMRVANALANAIGIDWRQWATTETLGALQINRSLEIADKTRSLQVLIRREW